MPRRRAASTAAPEGEAYNTNIRLQFEKYQNDHKTQFETFRVARSLAERYLQYLNDPELEAQDEDEQVIKRRATEWFSVIDGRLHVRDIADDNRQLCVIYDSSDVFDAVVTVHLEINHRKYAGTMDHVLARFHGISLQEIRWVVRHCLHCFGPRHQRRQQAALDPASGASPGRGKNASSTPSSTPRAEPDRHGGGRRDSDAAAPAHDVIAVGFVTVYIPEIAQGQDILVVYEAKSRRTSLSALAHATVDNIALGIANWATYRPSSSPSSPPPPPPPLLVRYAENVYSAGVLHALANRYAVPCKLGAALPLGPAQALADKIRAAVVGYFRRTKHPDWDSALQVANVELNSARHSAPAAAGSGSGLSSDTGLGGGEGGHGKQGRESGE